MMLKPESGTEFELACCCFLEKNTLWLQKMLPPCIFSPRIHGPLSHRNAVCTCHQDNLTAMQPGQIRLVGSCPAPGRWRSCIPALPAPHTASLPTSAPTDIGPKKSPQGSTAIVGPNAPKNSQPHFWGEHLLVLRSQSTQAGSYRNPNTISCKIWWSVK